MGEEEQPVVMTISYERSQNSEHDYGGERGYECAECGIECIVSDSTKDMLEEDDLELDDVNILCQDCGMALMEQEAEKQDKNGDGVAA